MKNKMIMVVGIMIVIAVIGISGAMYLKQEKNSQSAGENEQAVADTKGNYDVIEAMKHIDVTNTVEEMNDIIGFEGKQSLYNDDDFMWEFDDRNYITLKNAADIPIIEAKIDKRTIKNENIQFPAKEELSEIIEKGVTYEELVTRLGGVEGTLNGKAELSVDYIWVDQDRQTLYATFNRKTLVCSVATYTYREDD